LWHTPWYASSGAARMDAGREDRRGRHHQVIVALVGHALACPATNFSPTL
jgi:hypothetical protein